MRAKGVMLSARLTLGFVHDIGDAGIGERFGEDAEPRRQGNDSRRAPSSLLVGGH